MWEVRDLKTLEFEWGPLPFSVTEQDTKREKTAFKRVKFSCLYIWKQYQCRFTTLATFHWIRLNFLYITQNSLKIPWCSKWTAATLHPFWYLHKLTVTYFLFFYGLKASFNLVCPWQVKGGRLVGHTKQSQTEHLFFFFFFKQLFNGWMMIFCCIKGN